jgi:hypothetical protein
MLKDTMIKVTGQLTHSLIASHTCKKSYAMATYNMTLKIYLMLLHHSMCKGEKTVNLYQNYVNSTSQKVIIVDVDISLCEKPHLLLTLRRHMLNVCAVMYSKRSLPRKCFTTNSTFKWFFTSMYALMCDKMSTCIK